MQNEHIKIYREGKLSRWETYRPVLQEKITVIGNKIDYWFTHYGAWPSDEQLLQ